MNKEISEQQLEQQVTQLAKEIQPKRDLWSGIERAIAHASQEHGSQDIRPQANASQAAFKNKSNVFMPAAWAASVVAAVLLTWFSFNPKPMELNDSINLASTMQQDFEQQKQFVLASFGQPELKKLPKEMQSQLSELANARKAIATALKNDPNSSELLNLLRWTQKQELDLLKQLYSAQWQTI